jgi:Xaa-Pro aminopeptidase
VNSSTKAIVQPILAALIAGLLASRGASAQITKAEYAARRDSLAARIGTGVMVGYGGRTPVTDFGPFFQLPAFRYLTGYLYADAAFVLTAQGGRGTATLFVKRTDPRMALYYGQEPDSTELAEQLGLASRGIEEFTRVVDSLAATKQPFYSLHDAASSDFAAEDSLTRGGQLVKTLKANHPGLEIKDAHQIVDRLRARKSPAELALVRKAAEISADGHRELMKRIEVGMHEYDLQAIIESSFRRAGSERPAYGSIIGSGPLSLQLHYMKDRREMKPGEVVVIDAGAEFDGYTADVTRTLPVSGSYSPEQRAIYQIVRDAQAAAERNSRLGMSIRAAHDSSVAVRARGLAALGLIEAADATYDPPGAINCATQAAWCRQAALFTIHGITHGIGLEVHDPVQPYYDGVFKLGDAFVIEPGIYLSTTLLDLLPDTPKNRAFIAKVRQTVERYQNTGVRIEDSYLITDKGLEWISRVPRDLEEVEALTRRKPVP